eukprot:6197856-Pleurochrysis_carterae.AAC.4
MDEDFIKFIVDKAMEEADQDGEGALSYDELPLLQRKVPVNVCLYGGFAKQKDYLYPLKDRSALPYVVYILVSAKPMYLDALLPIYSEWSSELSNTIKGGTDYAYPAARSSMRMYILFRKFACHRAFIP